MNIRALITGLAAPLLLLAVPATAQLALEFPGGATQKFEQVTASASYQMPIGAFSGSAVPSRLTEGTVVQQVWRTNGGTLATLDLIAPLRTQMQAAGFDILFECDAKSCGGFDFRFDTEVVSEPEMHVDLGDFRFLSAAKDLDGKQEFISLLVSRSAEQGFIQLTRVGNDPSLLAGVTVSTKSTPPTEVETPETSPSLLALSEMLDLNGAAVLEGVRFANGRSKLSKDSAQPLGELAAYLKEHPKQKIILVGHTDAAGSLQGNIALSQKRAHAVMARLIDTFGINPKRLSAEGIGYLAPRASNATKDGRDLNRRVEVVLTLN